MLLQLAFVIHFGFCCCCLNSFAVGYVGLLLLATKLHRRLITEFNVINCNRTTNSSVAITLLGKSSVELVANFWHLPVDIYDWICQCNIVVVLLIVQCWLWWIVQVFPKFLKYKHANNSFFFVSTGVSVVCELNLGSIWSFIVFLGAIISFFWIKTTKFLHNYTFSLKRLLLLIMLRNISDKQKVNSNIVD